jgi:hypothetical protein
MINAQKSTAIVLLGRSMENLNELITAWYEAEKNAKAWAEQERDLRQRIVATAFPSPTVGTNKTRIDHGMALIGTVRINYKIDQEELSRCPPELVEKIIKLKPSLIESAWKSMTDNERKVFADAITETPGLPALELKPASKVRW